jgi:hypothetical protein
MLTGCITIFLLFLFFSCRKDLPEPDVQTQVYGIPYQTMNSSSSGSSSSSSGSSSSSSGGSTSSSSSSSSGSSSSSSSSGGTCLFTQWSTAAACSTGYYPIIGGCCPSDRPYSYDGGGCYATCSDAKTYAGSKTVYKAYLSYVATCNYVQWTGTGNCNSGYYPVYTGICCSSTYPYYNTSAGYCYKSCADAKSASSSGTVYRING